MSVQIVIVTFKHDQERIVGVFNNKRITNEL